MENIPAGSDVALPNILQVISEGAMYEKLKMILRLRKQLYHKSADQLRMLLRHAGAPLNGLVYVGDAVKLCVVRKR